MKEHGQACCRCAIRETLARYNVTGDRNRVEELAETFTEDGRLDTGYWIAEGRAQIIARLRGVVDSPDPRLTKVRHHRTTEAIELRSATEADALTYFIVFTDIGPDHSGTYRDRLVLEKGHWLIATRTMRLDWIASDTLMVPDSPPSGR